MSVLSTLARAPIKVARCLYQKAAPEYSGTPLPLQNIGRILWIRLDHIGDVTMSLPALHALRLQFPRARLDVLVRPAVAPLLAELPYIDSIFTYDTIRFPQRRNKWGRGAGLFRTIALIHRLRRRKYDVAIEMRGDDIGRLLAFCSGAPLLIGPDRVFYEQTGAVNLSFLQTHTVPLPDLRSTPVHTVETDLAMLQTLGLADAATEFRFPLKPQRKAAVERKLQSLGVQRPFAVLHMRSNDKGRDWSVEGFAAVANHLVQAHNLDVVLTGTHGDSDYNAQVLARSTPKPHIFNAAGLFKLEELPALFAKTRLMVTVDTGPMHIAAMMGTPIVAIFLPQLAAIHHPYGQSDGVVLPNSPELAALDFAALKQVTASGVLEQAVGITDVIAAIKRKLQGSASAPAKSYN